MTAPVLRQRIADGERLRGLLVRVPATTLIDMAGDQGYDYIFLDTEHGVSDLRDIAEHVAVARTFGLPVLVRVGEEEPAAVLRLLDLGVEGIIIPHVRNADEAEAAVRRLHYPPRGERGFATYTTVGRWGRVPAAQHAFEMARRVVAVAMIECESGVRESANILATPDVDIVFVGPADLTASLGFDDVAAREAQTAVWTEARRQGVAIMALVGTAEQASLAFEAGASMVTLNAQALVDRALGAWIRESGGLQRP